MGMYVTVKAVPANNPDAHGESVSLEKAWHGLHYLLTGSATEGPPPLGFILEGGKPIGDGGGYGPPRLFSPSEVQQMHKALSAISDNKLWSRFNAEEMTDQDVYPGIWDEPEEELREEYVMYFNELKKLFAAAASKKLAVVVRLD
jgi:hypothetical protein